ncbi:MAG: D-alanine--D-alanine ligase [Clostridia bacterium]|nr:D-alanine--D-alanine ligase [Clostridia bacterium]MBQ3870115.1 D-alanine--D-alanine ligase [Clostridia bacterium]
MNELIILFGGRSAEYEVSLRSAYNVIKAIENGGYSLINIGMSRDGLWYEYSGDIEKIKSGEWISDKENLGGVSLLPHKGIYSEKRKRLIPNTTPVFPAVHGSYCEDGKLQGLLDMCGFDYVGPKTTASAVCMDKHITKLIMNSFGIPQADFILITKHNKNDAAKLVSEKFAYPVFVKPANAGSSVGSSKVCCEAELLTAIDGSMRYDGKVLVEEYVKGKEVEIAVMGNDEPFTSRPGEICPNSEFYDYDTKYKTDTAAFYIPARISAETEEKIREYALTIYKAADCRCLSRVDFFVCDNGRIVFNEINTLPGFTSISMYPSLMQAFGFTYAEIVEKLIGLSKEKE